MTLKQQRRKSLEKSTELLKIDQLTLRSDDDELFIFMSKLPGRRIRSDIRNLSTDLNQIQVDTMITLNEDKELSFMNFTNNDEYDDTFDMTIYSSRIKQANIEHILYPIRDRFVPTSIRDYMQMLILILSNNTDYHQRRRILVHCMGGMGRTGMTVVCLELVYEYLMSHKQQQQPQSFIERFVHYPLLLKNHCRVCRAILNVRTARRGTIHNPLQILFAHEFYARLKCSSYMRQMKK
ncbi:unnamed protein product [Didymodactylos carnosus]|uniref:Tyrosine specific protein phosphatases domain-containing protein n=1 Tax=Didymodactylos carnosus TaxID=1234261 RepID=A0A815UL75_9BILA|nr:unnamed protein product [Didymodactylos carnosus]CAF1521404.1 unnamed protein product [Didymodactylos carnosus]CAF3588442.1 unnamed protein product [Didymodactylos carnosus]CAF4380726.1 unnamed protein product [Didymodactylos carnosus]